MFIMTENGWKPLATVPASTHYVEDGKKYYGNFNKSFYTKDRTPRAFINRIDRDILDSKKARGAISPQAYNAGIAEIASRAQF